MLYEKRAGRSADPAQLRGEALAGASKRSSQMGTRIDSKGGRPESTVMGLRAQWWISILLSLVVLGVLSAALA